MGLLKRRSPLERLALLVLLVTIGCIVVVATGVFRDSRATTAERLTALCAPVRSVLSTDDPTAMTNRDLLLMRQEIELVGNRLGELAKDAGDDERRALRNLRRGYELGANLDGTLTIAQRADILTKIATRSAAIGASCPSPLTVAQGQAIDKRLAAERTRANGTGKLPRSLEDAGVQRSLEERLP